MEYIGWALASMSTVDPERAIFAAGGAVAAGLVIFFVRNQRNLAERIKKHHG
nr:hypothetical protein [uncultured Merdimonas sp.]